MYWKDRLAASSSFFPGFLYGTWYTIRFKCVSRTAKTHFGHRR